MVVNYKTDSNNGWAMYCDSNNECGNIDDNMPALETELESSNNEEERIDELSRVGEVEDVLGT